MENSKQWPFVSVQPVDATATSSRRSSYPLSPHGQHTNSGQPDNLQDWPTEAHNLEERQREWTVIAYDTVLIILPLGLLAKAIVVSIFGDNAGRNLDEVPLETLRLVEFNDQLVTLFTVIFGTIVATLVRRFALWKAQTGASVTTLEQLHSSISLPKTLSLVWSLRSWTWTSVVLILMWYIVPQYVLKLLLTSSAHRSWYYLGSQAVSRELRFYDGPAVYNLTVAYPNTAAVSIFEKGLPSSTDSAGMNARFVQAVQLQASEFFKTNNGWDSAGNTLIPVRSPLYMRGDLSATTLDKGGWWQTSYTSRQFWSSYIGVQLTARYRDSSVISTSEEGYCWGCWLLTEKILGKGILSTSYIHPNCSFPELQSKEAFPGASSYIKTVLNMTNSSIPTISISELWNNNSTIVSVCNLTETKVDIELLCTAQGCRSVRERPIIGQTISNSLFKNQTAFTFFLDGLQTSGGVPTTNSSTQLALLDTLKPKNAFFYLWKTKYYHPNIAWSDSEIAEDFSLNLMALINVYLVNSQQALLNSTRQHTIDVLRGATPDPALSLTTMKGSEYLPQYRINWPWMVVDFVGCVVLLAAASAAVWLRRRTLAPDIFGYVSSLTRDNPMINLPKGGSTLNGIDRARMLRGVKVKIADVGGNDALGRVGLAMKNESSENVAELRKGKAYV